MHLTNRRGVEGYFAKELKYTREVFQFSWTSFHSNLSLLNFSFGG